MESFIEYETFLKTQESKQNIFEINFDHEITLKHIERLLNTNIEKNTDGLFSYILIKNFCTEAVSNEEDYVSLQCALAKIFDYCAASEKNSPVSVVVFPILDDVCSSDSNGGKTSILKCAVLDAFVEKAPRSFYSAVSSIIENMTIKHNITYLADVLNQVNSDVMNLMLDNLILELRIMAMYLEVEKPKKIELFDFSKAYFDEIFFLISTSEIMEEDMTVLFVLNYKISALTNEHVLPITAEILNSRDFMVSEVCMAKIFKEIMYTLSLKPFNTFAHFLAFIFTSPALVCFNAKNASSIISYVVKQCCKSKEAAKVFRKIYFDIRDSGESKVITNFFNAISEVDAGHYFSEFHSFFLEQMNKYDIMEYYAGFIANSQIALPVHVFLGHCSHSKIFTFYKAFFKKVKKGNEEQIKSRKSPTNKIILELFRFIVESKDQELVYLLPLVPFVPTNLDTLYAVFELYIFLFSMNLHKKMHLFYLKTPALINISFHLFVLDELNPEIVTFLREIGIKEANPQNLAFLAIIYNAESKKLENFDFSGVLEYVQDEKTLQSFDEDLRTLMKHIHASCRFPSKEFNKLYVDTILLILKKGTFRTTKLIFIDILSVLLKKDTLSKYDLGFHRNFFVILKSMELSEDTQLFTESLNMYLNTLDTLKTTPYILNYIICFIADFKCTYKNLHFIIAENIIHFINTTDFTMRRIMSFPNIGKETLECNCDQCKSRNEVDNDAYSEPADKNETGVHVADRTLRSLYYDTIVDDLTWIIDLVCTRRSCPEVARRSLELLKMRVYLSLSLKDLLILYKICNILNVERNQSFYAFLVIKYNPSIIHEKHTIQLLAKEAKGLYRYHFENLHAATNSISVSLETENLEMYSLEELVYFNNLYRKSSIYDLTWDKITEKIAVSRDDTMGDSILHIGYDDFGASISETQLSRVSAKQSTRHLIFTKRSWIEEKMYIDSLLEDCGIDFTHKRSADSIITPVDSGRDMFLCKSARYFICSTNITILDLITILQKMQSSISIIETAKGILKRVDMANIVFFIPQLVQCLFKRGFLGAFDFLLEEDELVHQLIWNMRANKVNTDHILEIIGPKRRAFFSLEDAVFKALANISKNLIVFVRETKAFKTLQINKELDGIQNLIQRTTAEIQSISERQDLKAHKAENVSDSELHIKGIYLPTDPKSIISNIVSGSGRSLQSAAKMPFMVSFKMKDGADKKLILKNGDDCRQDMLALQVIELFRAIFKESNLDISLFPYKVVAIDFECGVIEVIENAITRDQMGKEQINSLTEFFEYKFGFRESRSYMQALQNFVSSYTGYSLVTYFLNIKDRHNGNIMIDDKGHIIHIDFGFMLEISPGNINFEIPLKLTGEIHDLMKGVYFERYKELMVKGFLAIRKRSKEVMWLIESFRDSKLPCFRKNAIKNLDKRFMHELDDEGAKKFVLNLIEKSVLSHRTWIYDKYQAMANDIRF